MSRSAGNRSLGSRGMVVLERLYGHLSFEQRLDAAERRLGAVHRRVIGDVLSQRRPASEVGVLAGTAVMPWRLRSLAVPTVATSEKPISASRLAVWSTARLSRSLTERNTLPDVGSGEPAAICDLI